MGVRIEDALDDFAEEFGIDAQDRDSIKTRIVDERIPPLALNMALADMRDMKKKGQDIRSPQGLLTHLMRKHSAAPEVARSGSNPLTGDGYDFWRGDRTWSDKVCQAIMWSSEADDSEDRQKALDLLADCAPCLRDSELEWMLEVAHDYDGNYGVAGPYSLRLAKACRLVLSLRAAEDAA